MGWVTFTRSLTPYPGHFYSSEITLVVILLMLGTLKGQSSSSFFGVGLQEARSKSERVQLAEDLLGIFEPIDAAVPTLSPSQKEWLAEERKAGVDVIKSSQRARILNFYQSQEFTIEYTKTRLSSVVSFLQVLTGQKKVADVELSTRTQVFLWSEVAYILIEPDFYTYLTRLQEQSFFDDLSPSAMSFLDSVDLAGIYGRTILGSIVMPYLGFEQFPE